MKFDKDDAFCEVYGFTLKNLVWGHFLTWHETAVGDMAKELNISRPKAYQIIDEFTKKEYIIKSRIFGKTQLYKLNTDNYVVKIYTRNFKECIQSVINKYSKKKNSGNISIAVSTKTL